MKLKNSLIIAAYSAISILVLTQSVHALTVPASEVPNNCTWVTNQGCDASFYYTRTDAYSITNIGNPDTYQGQEHDCNNCGSKNVMTCLTTLTADFSNSVTNSIDGSIGVDVAGIKAGLSSQLGGTNGQTVHFSTVCGSSQIAPCTDTDYTATQDIKRSILATCTSSYTCYIHCAGDPSSKDGSQAGGTRTSTAVGNIGQGSGSCKSKDLPCDPKTCCA